MALKLEQYSNMLNLKSMGVVMDVTVKEKPELCRELCKNARNSLLRFIICQSKIFSDSNPTILSDSTPL